MVIGPILTGASSIIGAFNRPAPQGQVGMAPGFDLSPIYASLLTADQTLLSTAGQEMASFLGMYNQGEGLQNQIGYNQTMGQFNEAMNQQRQATALRTGVASQLAGNAIGLQTEESKAKLAAQMGAVQNSLAMRQDQRDAKQAYDKIGLQASGQLMGQGLNNTMQLQQTSLNRSADLQKAGLDNASAANLAGLRNQADLLGKSVGASAQLMAQGNELRARQQETGLREAAATDRAGVQAQTQQNIAALGNEQNLLMQGLKGTQELQQTQAKGEIQAGLAAQGTSNQLAQAQGLSNVQIGQGQEGLRNELIKLGAQTDADTFKGAVANIQGGQRQQEMLRGEGVRQSQMLVGQTDQQRQIQEDRFAGEASLIAGKALADQEQLIGKTRADQSLLYGNLQADKVRTDMQQGGAVERAREDFSQKFALQDAAFKQEMAKKRFGASMAMAGQRAFA